MILAILQIFGIVKTKVCLTSFYKEAPKQSNQEMAYRLNANVSIENTFNIAMLLIVYEETGRYFNIDIFLEKQSKHH